MIIGIAGLARTGKDEAANHLAVSLNMYKCAFADQVKRTAMTMFGLTETQTWGLNGYDREKVVDPWGISVREILQKVGTECGREVFREDFWQICLEQYLDKTTYKDRFIVSDVRFDNEVQWVKDKGGFVIEIQLPGIAGVGIEGHKSEQGVTDPTIVVINAGTKQQLYDTLDEVVRTNMQKEIWAKGDYYYDCRDY